MSAALALLAAALVPLGDPATWITEQDYPAEARRFEEAGTTTVSLTVDGAGKVTACDVAVSSSSARLDSATCALLVQRARFREPQENAVRTMQFSVKWELSDPLPMALGEVIADIALDDQGRILGCVERMVGDRMIIPGSPCDFGPETIDRLFGKTLEGASRAHFRLAVLPRDIGTISIAVEPEKPRHQIIIELHTEVTPMGFATDCRTVAVHGLFGSMDPCSWMSKTSPDFAPDPGATTNRPVKLVLDTWVELD